MRTDVSFRSGRSPQIGERLGLPRRAMGGVCTGRPGDATNSTDSLRTSHQRLPGTRGAALDRTTGLLLLFATLATLEPCQENGGVCAAEAGSAQRSQQQQAVASSGACGWQHAPIQRLSQPAGVGARLNCSRGRHGGPRDAIEAASPWSADPGSPASGRASAPADRRRVGQAPGKQAIPDHECARIGELAAWPRCRAHDSAASRPQPACRKELHPVRATRGRLAVIPSSCVVWYTRLGPAGRIPVLARSEHAFLALRQCCTFAGCSSRLRDRHSDARRKQQGRRY